MNSLLTDNSNRASWPGAVELPPEAKLTFLSHSANYPDKPYRVDTVETHMAWVFLTDRHAYKMKKPVRYDLLDFRSASARRHFCEEEVRLNRRLAPSVYLGVVELTLDRRGHLVLGGDGPAVDWLVKMRRLPEASMLDYRLQHASAGAAEMHAIAVRLAAFYRSLPPQRIDGLVYRTRIALHLIACQRELTVAGAPLPAERVNRLCHHLRLLLQHLAPLFDLRAAEGKIVEGHGDLRPEHICLDSDISIIDCLEFSRALRTVDRADELAFLALEIERGGAPQLATMLLRAYRLLSGDRPRAALTQFYQCYRALVRATLALRHLHEERYRYSPQWAAKACAYLRLAECHARMPHPSASINLRKSSHRPID